MSTAETRTVLATIFGRLFENEFATLDGIAISCRTADGMDLVQDVSALRLWLDDRASPTEPALPDPAVPELHAACYEAAPAHEAVISGWSRHLRALLLEGYPPPPATSMMRNRGVPDLAAHLVEPAALTAEALLDALARARELAEAGAMRHHLLITSEGYVVVSGAPPYEAMAHWHNVELAARVECLRLEDAALTGED